MCLSSWFYVNSEGMLRVWLLRSCRGRLSLYLSVQDDFVQLLLQTLQPVTLSRLMAVATVVHLLSRQTYKSAGAVCLEP